MDKHLIGMAAVLLTALHASLALAAGEIVVANRYLLANKTSHAHLYLYREDGKLLRQLTHSDAGQDRNPIFAPDGETIVWTREFPGKPKQVWSIRPRGTGLRLLKVVPAWYRSTRTSNYFTNTGSYGAYSTINPEPGDKAPRVRTPDGQWEIVLRELASNEDDAGDGPGHGKSYLLRNLKTKEETEFGKLPGFYGVFDLLHSQRDAKQRFLWEKNFQAAFFGLHLNSTDGDTTYALDLIKKRLVRLSPNWAAPLPLAGESAFLTLTYQRYVPIPKTKKTANCCYMERWDEKFHKVRYASRNCVICYGASLYRPGKTPRVVTIRDGGE
jgi:hypothetical protein